MCAGGSRQFAIGLMLCLPCYGGPVYGGEALLQQDVVALREMAAAEESSVCRERRGMWGCEHEVFGAVYECRLANGIAAPQQEDYALPVE